MPDRRHEKGPAGNGANSETQKAGEPASSLVDSAAVRTDHRSIAWDVSDLEPAMQARVTRAWTDGYAAGINAGRRQVEAEDAESWARMRESIRQAAQTPDYAALAERRGQHARAAATRALWAARGLAEGVAS